MNMEQAVKDVAADAGSASVVKAVSRFHGAASGVVAELLLTDLDTAETSVELAHVDEEGRCIETAVPGRRGMDHLAAAGTPGVVMMAGRAIALRPGAEATAAAIAATSPDGVARLHGDGAWYVVHGPFQRSLHAVTQDGARVRSLDTTSLSLGGGRQITDVGLLSGILHVAVSDPVAGFDLFRCDLASGDTGFTLALSRGAYRFALNGAIASMAVSDRGLLMGTAALAGMVNPVGYWGPELLLVTGDGKWDLLIGQPRFTPDGMMLPASGLLPGLGDARNAAIKAIAQAGDETVIAIQSFAGEPQDDRRESRPDFFDYRGAVRLYRSPDFVEWHEVPHALPRDADPVTALAVAKGRLYVGFENLSHGGLPVHVVPL